MASLLRYLAPRTPLVVGLSDTYGIPNLPIHGFPVHSNLTQSIVYEISKHRLLQCWVDRKITHMLDWDGIDLSPFELAWDRDTFHMSHFVTKCISNTLYTMNIYSNEDMHTLNSFRAVV